MEGKYHDEKVMGEVRGKQNYDSSETVILCILTINL